MWKSRRTAGAVLGLTAVVAAYFMAIRPAPPDPTPARNVPFEPIAARADSASSAEYALEATPPEQRAAEKAPAPRPRPSAPPLPTPVEQEEAETVVTGEETALTSAIAGGTGQEVATVVAESATTPEDDADVLVYIPGCVGRAKRYWAAGTPPPAESGTQTASTNTRRRGCGSGPPREIVINNFLSGLCANPAKDRGLPAMCGQASRRR